MSARRLSVSLLARARKGIAWPWGKCALAAAGCIALIGLAAFRVPGALWLMAGALVLYTAHYGWRILGRNRLDGELIGEHTLFEAVLNTVPYALYVKDLGQRLVLVNHATEIMAGLPARDLVGKHIAALSQAVVLPQDQIHQVEETDAQVLETGQPVEFVIERVFPEGRRQMRVIKSPVRNSEGKITGMLLMAEDITARLAAEQEVREQRALLRTVFDAIPHYLYVKDRDDRFIMVNRTMERRLPAGSPPLIGQRAMMGLERKPEELEQVGRDNRRVLDEDASLDFRRDIAFATYGTRHMRTIKVPLKNSAGETIGLIGLDEDETDRVEAERQVSEQRELLQAVIDAIPQDLFVKDQSGKVIMANQTLADRWHKPKAELLGVRGLGLDGISAEDLHRIEESDRRVLVEGKRDNWVQTLKDPSARESTFRVHKVPLRNAKGAIVGLVMTGEDITALVESQRELAASQRLLSTVLAAIPESVSLKDAQRRYQLVNRDMPERLGLSSAQIVGLAADDLPLLTAESKANIRRSDEEVLANGKPAALPLVEWVRPDGGVRWERVLKQPVRDQNGVITGIVTIGEDITDLVEARQEVERARGLLQTIMDTLPAGVFVKDLQGRFTMANTPFAAIYGITPQELLGRTSRELPHLNSERQEQFADEDQRILRQGEPVDSGTFLGPNLPGRPLRWFRVIKVPLRSESGGIHGIVGLAEDVTAQKRAEEERMAINRLMQRTQNLESLGVMAAGIAHEFNNLLQRIMGHTELVLAEIPREHALRRDVEMIQQASRTAVALTNQMVTLSGRSRFKVEPVQIRQLVEGLLTDIRNLLPPRVVFSHYVHSERQVALADEPLLQQVIVSLVINAIEAVQESGGHVRLEVGKTQIEPEMLKSHAYSDRSLRPGEYVYVEVRDSGPGIPQEILDRIYEPFFSTKFIGRGLGLAAVRGIVHGHQGALHVRSKLGEGTAFRVLLPITRD